VRVSLRDVEIRRGEWTLSAAGVFGEGRHLVTGPVGSGKSTLALLLAGIIAPERGTVVREGSGPLFLSLPFPEHHTTGATVGRRSPPGGGRGAGPGRLGSGGDEPGTAVPAEPGELKRFHLACVLARRWELLLLDEPYNRPGLLRPGCALDASLGSPRSHHRDLHPCPGIPPRVDRLWEIREGRLVIWARSRTRSPLVLAPAYIRIALEEGAAPANISVEDVREALCRTDG